MKRILVVAALLIAVFSFSGCYPSGVVVRTGPPRYYSPKPYYYGYGRPHYYGGYRHHYYGHRRW